MPSIRLYPRELSPTPVLRLRAAVLAAALFMSLIASAAALAHNDNGEADGISHKQLLLNRAEINDRQARFFNDDFNAVWKQIEQADLKNPRERATVRGSVARWLGRDLKQLQQILAETGDPAAVRNVEKSLRETQIEARKNINELTDGKPLEIAREHHKKMTGQWERLSKHYRLCLEAARIMERRERLLAFWRKLGVQNDRLYTIEREEVLRGRIEKAAGMKLDEMQRAMNAPLHQPPAWKDLTRRYLWQYGKARDIANYNRTFVGQMDAQEYGNLELLNAYREAVGILPLEIDARALQSARRHSKEMVELGYFSHTSPTPENRTFGMRMKLAGYIRPAGENIAYGYSSGEKAFWGWFYSSGHHKNMMNPRFTAIGVGRWQRHYTQNFGTGKRLMLLDHDAREKVAVVGEIVEPQG